MNDGNLGIAGGTIVPPAEPKKVGIDEEAKAEEAFVNDAEDKVFNPFVGNENDAAAEEEEILTEADMAIPGAVGSGNLETVMPGNPINNEATLGTASGMADVDVRSDLQSDIVETPIMQDGALASEEETIKVNLGENMQPEQNPGVENTELGSQMDSLLNEEPVVGNTTAETPAAGAVVGNTTPATDSFANNPVVGAPVAGAPVNATADVAATGVAQPAKPVKKKKTGAIIAIVVLLLVLIGGGVGAAVFFNWHESKDKVVADAMSKLLNAELVDSKYVSINNGVGVTKISGKLEVLTDAEESEYYASVKKTTFTIKGESEEVSGAYKGEVEFEFTDDSTVKVDSEVAYIQGGKIYIKLGDLSNYEDISSAMMGYKMIDDGSSDVAIKKDASEQFSELMVKTVVDKINGQWIAITNDTFKQFIGDGYNNEFSCIMENYEKVGKDSKAKILEAYSKNSFFEFGDVAENVSGAKDDLTYYEVKLNEDKAKAFGNEVAKIDFAGDMKKCLASVAEEVTGDEDIDDSFVIDGNSIDKPKEDEKVTTHYYFGIKGWSHEVENVIITVKDEDAKTDVKGNFDLSYEKVSVAEPSDAKELYAFLEELVETVKKTAVDNKELFIKGECEYEFTTASRAACEAEAEQKLEEIKGYTLKDIIAEMMSAGVVSDDDFEDDYDWEEWDYEELDWD